jgi:hypothetical protein
MRENKWCGDSRGDARWRQCVNIIYCSYSENEETMVDAVLTFKQT